MKQKRKMFVLTWNMLVFRASNPAPKLQSRGIAGLSPLIPRDPAGFAGLPRNHKFWVYFIKNKIKEAVN